MRLRNLVSGLVVAGALMATSTPAVASIDVISVGASSTVATGTVTLAQASYVGPMWVAWRVLVTSDWELLEMVGVSAGAGCQPTFGEVIATDGNPAGASWGGGCVPMSASVAGLNSPAVGLESDLGFLLKRGEYWIVGAFNASPGSAGTVSLIGGRQAGPQAVVEGMTTGSAVHEFTDADFARASGGSFTSVPGHTHADIHGSIRVEAQHTLLGLFSPGSHWDHETLSYTAPNGREYQDTALVVGLQERPLGTEGVGRYTFNLDEHFTDASTTLEQPTTLTTMDVIFP
jgi:hypothetical protein